MNQTESLVLKRNKPEFSRYLSKNLKKLKSSWRRPKGLHNKLRLGFRGYGKSPSIGYKQNKKLRQIDVNFSAIVVKNLKDLEKIKDESIIISSNVGLRKKVLMLKKIKEQKLTLLNIKDIDKFLEKVEANLKKKKEESKKKTKEKAKKEKVEEKKETEKKKETKEEKEKREKLEKKKVLEGKQSIKKGGLA